MRSLDTYLMHMSVTMIFIIKIDIVNHIWKQQIQNPIQSKKFDFENNN